MCRNERARPLATRAPQPLGMAAAPWPCQPEPPNALEGLPPDLGLGQTLNMDVFLLAAVHIHQPELCTVAMLASETVIIPTGILEMRHKESLQSNIATLQIRDQVLPSPTCLLQILQIL